MSSDQGAPRRRLLIAMCPAGPHPIVDVGADHGKVARAVGAIATERMPGRMGTRDVPWVVADGLAPFRKVGVAIIAGMGARTIAGILERGPRPQVAVLHAQDDPPTLRYWLAANGWRIDAEALAPEARRFAEVIRAVPGQEAATGLRLHWGPRLLDSADPLLIPHLTHERERWQAIADATADTAPRRHAEAAGHVAFLTGLLP